MEPIKAIVFTYDKYRIFTDHMICRYNELWPDHPFVFQVPYQDLSPSLPTSRVQYIKAPADIKGTMQALLRGLDDEEMIYWCIDDKYPIELDIKNIESLHRYLLSTDNPQISGLLYCRCRGMLLRQNLTGKKLADDQGRAWLERKDYKQIWIHQYLRVKVLRYLFDSFPQDIPNAKTMDYFKDQLKKPKDHRLFVTAENFSVFGESTLRGVITKNCLDSIQSHHLALPSWISEMTPRQEVIMGNAGENPPPTLLSRLLRRLTQRRI
ncbi:MAG: hypothetical protein GC158_10485 [Cyanobacteria bacterium RI_101]|nr:hypothetical protein [Cyanobacteria bacterium RI_101]